MWWLLALLAVVEARGGKFATDHNLTGLRWRTLETERLRIHYPESAKVSASRTAVEVAEVADEILERIEVAQGSHLNETIHIVVLDHDDTLGGFTVPQWDWVVISAHQGPDLHRTRGRMSWVSDVLAHEFGHLVAHKRAGALAEGANYGLHLGLYGEAGLGLGGAKVTLSPHEPYWWAEGGAEYLSELAGYNWWSTSRDANLRMTVLSGRLLSWRELQSNRDKDTWNDAERGYQQGYAFARWIDGTNGRGTFTSIANEARRGLGRWDRAVSRTLGEPGSRAWERFADEARDRYVAQRAEVEAAGLVEGAELVLWQGAWQSESLRSRDVFADNPPRQREEAREASGAWNLYPRYSEDGAWYAEHRVGWVRIRPVAESLWPALSGEPVDRELSAAQLTERFERGTWLPARFGYGFDFVPGRNALVVTALVGTHRPASLGPSSAFTWNQLFVVDITPDSDRRRHRQGQEDFETLSVGGRGGQIRRRYTPIPGTERGSDPAVSPDGERVAYLHYGDGTMNLVVSGLDGSDTRTLSSFDDGTWLQGPDWSPDGRRIVVAVSRNYQQNLWIVDVESSSWTPITDDGWEELDPHWGEDGIYFAADPTGIFNIFRWSEGVFTQITNVVGGASTPSLTPHGDLLFSNYTAFGHKAHGLRREAFFDVPSTTFGAIGEPDLSWRPETREWTSHRYRPLKSLAVPSTGPVARLDLAADGLTPRGGAFLKLRDYLEDHDLAFYGLVGRDYLLEGAYTFRGLRPDIRIWGAWEDDTRSVVSLEPNLSTGEDRRTLASGGLQLSLPYREKIAVDLDAHRLVLGYAPMTSDLVSTLLRSDRFSVSLRLGSETKARLVDDPQAQLAVAYRRGQSTLAVAERDDGDLLDAYGYNQVRSELGLVFPFGGGAFEFHRLDLGWDLVFTDANIFREEEPRAGGDHPYALRMSVLDPSASMPGYAPWALSGEELAIAHLGWRFPLIRRFGHARGSSARFPYAEQIWARLGTDMGNVWSFDGRTDHDNPLLVDVTAELRFAASLFDSSWDSSLGIAHGFQTVAYPRGPSEPLTKPQGADSSGLRLYLGVGTGW